MQFKREPRGKAMEIMLPKTRRYPNSFLGSDKRLTTIDLGGGLNTAAYRVCFATDAWCAQPRPNRRLENTSIGQGQNISHRTEIKSPPNTSLYLVDSHPVDLHSVQSAPAPTLARSLATLGRSRGRASASNQAPSSLARIGPLNAAFQRRVRCA